MTLRQYLAQAARTPFAWSGFHCCAFPADWVAARRGVDPMAHLRGLVSSEADAEALLMELGGIKAAWRTCCSDAGLEPASEARRGDVGLIAALTAKGVAAAGAISLGRGRWTGLAPKGLFVGPAVQIAAWRV